MTMIRYLFLLVRIPLVMLHVDVTVVVRHFLLGVTVCLQDLFFVAVISVATPLGWISVVIITQRLLGIDGCPHYLCLVARTCALQLGYALFVFFQIVLAIIPCKSLCCWALLWEAPACAYFHCCCPAQCPRRIPSFNTPPTQRVSLDPSR